MPGSESLVAFEAFDRDIELREVTLPKLKTLARD